jgi:ATPase components of ABC transporters with duplicated ATPase domains
MVPGISANYPGAIVMISHDREFLNQLVGSIVEIAHSKLVRYRGDWDSYVEQKARAKNNSSPLTKISRKKSRRCNCLPIDFAPRQAKHRKHRAS